MIYFLLFFEFFQIGLFSIGGGMATIPFLNRLADKYEWYTSEMLTNMIAISETAPGPIGVKMSAYAGYSAAGIPGALIATFGLIVPGIIIVAFVVRALSTFNNSKYVQSAFYGLRPAVAGLVAWAVLSVGKGRVFYINTSPGSLIPESVALPFKQLILLTALLLAVKFVKRIPPLVVLGASAAVGIIFKF